VTMRIGLGFDVHAFGGDGPLVLGGVTVPNAPGLTGHSDADVVAHAVADALLGAASMPDLGTLFPSTDPDLRGVSSMVLLGDVHAKVLAAGWVVANVDVVIAAEAPALAPHVAAMSARLGEAVGAPVSVKPKRAEGVGAIGRGDGVAAWAVALLESAE
jgi:2-C-methyl-D-erythritol 2,4-cyclodiphosphate synthase